MAFASMPFFLTKLFQAQRQQEGREQQQQELLFLPWATPLPPDKELHIRYGFLPHFVGGSDIVKSLLFPPYPAIPPYVVRTPHPGITDGREHITACIIIGCLPNTSFSDPYMSAMHKHQKFNGCSIECWQASIKAPESPLT